MMAFTNAHPAQGPSAVMQRSPGLTIAGVAQMQPQSPLYGDGTAGIGTASIGTRESIRDSTRDGTAALQSPAIARMYGAEAHQRARGTSPRAGSMPSPRVSEAAQPNPKPASLAFYTPQDRSLPGRDVDEAGLEEAFVRFILYCNPAYGLDAETTDLRKTFVTPPRSDGKNFRIWAVFELLRRFNGREIKTWAQLVVELGVERPSAEKGQSSQKVQQYCARLKRWLHALHVDAFFDYLVGKSHPYYVYIPHPHAPYPDQGRDGVPLEEDLAIRSLDPRLRPKIGRRKKDDGSIGDGDAAVKRTPPKRPRLDTSSAMAAAVPMWMPRAVPLSAIEPSTSLLTPDGRNGAGSPAPSAALVRNDSVISLHTMSAVEPHSRQTLEQALAERQSSAASASAAAAAGNKTPSRRRHGSAVSSAWNHGQTVPGSKTKGRPPSARWTDNGPFSAFPASSIQEDGAAAAAAATTPAEPTGLQGSSASGQREPEGPSPAFSPSATRPSLGKARPDPITLDPSLAHDDARGELTQSSQPAGYLTTPTLLVEGIAEPGPHSPLTPSQTRASSPHIANMRRSSEGMVRTNPRSPGPASNGTQQPAATAAAAASTAAAAQLKRALIADLLRADTFDHKRLSGAQARGLAEALLKQLPPLRGPDARGGGGVGGAGVDDSNTDDSGRGLHAIASWLGLSKQLGLLPAPVGAGKKVWVQRCSVDQDGFEVPLEDGNDLPAHHATVRETYDISWSLMLGDLCGDFQLKGISLADGAADRTANGALLSGLADHTPDVGGSSPAHLQQQLLQMQHQLQAKDQELQRLRDQVLEAVI